MELARAPAGRARRTDAPYEARQRRLREAWTDSVYWLRAYVVSATAGLRDAEAVAQRLIRAFDEVARASERVTLKALLRDHVLVTVRIVDGARRGELPTKVLRESAENAAEIASLIGGVRSSDALREYVELIGQVIRAHLRGRFSEEVELFDQVRSQALTIADMMSFQ